MKRFFCALIGILTAIHLAHADSINSTLLQQFSSDMTALMLSQNVEGVPLTDAAIKQAVASSTKAHQQKDPALFITASEETTLLAAGKNVVTEQEMANSIEARRIYKTPLPFPPILKYYEGLKIGAGLNPYQRLLAYRIAEHSLRKAKDRDEIQSQIRKGN